jgi:hypothetical protein
MLQSRFGGSVLKALAAAYPDHKWQAWSFKRTAKEETVETTETAT